MRPEFSPLDSLKTPPTLKDMAFDAIRDSIVFGTLKPGEIYSEQVLASELGISKTPVHDAIVKLLMRGFINILPQRGFQVKVLSHKDVSDIYEFRTALEKQVMRHITPKITDAQLEDCRPFLADINQFDSVMQFLQNDIRFHCYMAELTTNPQIINALEGIWDLCLWVGYGAMGQKKIAENATNEHSAIFKILERHDAAAAEIVITKHIQATLERVLEAM